MNKTERDIRVENVHIDARLYEHLSRKDWIAFMDEVVKLFPFLFRPGRPNKQHIENSLVGYFGYSSWQDYIEGQLLLNVSTWHQWYRAYKVVRKYPYLREIQATPSVIVKRYYNEKTFPGTAGEWVTLNEKRKSGKYKQQLPAMEEKIIELESRVASLEAKLAKLIK